MELFLCVSFISYGQYYPKNVKVRAQKKKLKIGRQGDLHIERVFSKEGRIKPARNAFTKKL